MEWDVKMKVYMISYTEALKRDCCCKLDLNDVLVVRGCGDE